MCKYILALICLTSGLVHARFIEVDPQREFVNGFSYVGNSPVIAIDPDGMAHDQTQFENHADEGVKAGFQIFLENFLSTPEGRALYEKFDGENEPDITWVALEIEDDGNSQIIGMARNYKFDENNNLISAELAINPQVIKRGRLPSTSVNKDHYAHFEELTNATRSHVIYTVYLMAHEMGHIEEKLDPVKVIAYIQAGEAMALSRTESERIRALYGNAGYARNITQILIDADKIAKDWKKNSENYADKIGYDVAKSKLE